MNTDKTYKFFFYFLVTLSVVIRISLLPVVSLDTRTFLLQWYNYIVIHGAWISLGDEFSNYTPPYLYLLTIATYTNGFLAKTTAIKLISILFDFFNAYLVFRIIKLRSQTEHTPLIAAALFLCLPTIALNSSAWGQADSIYTCFILISMYHLLQNAPLPAIISFGISFAFKAQAIFFSPFLLLLTIRKRIPWHYYFLVPIVYLVMMAPALIVGRSLSSVLGVYLGQTETFKSLSMKAPNPYLFISNDLYIPVLYIGIIITVIATLFWAIGYAVKLKEINKEVMIFCATVSVAMIPLLLPKMHERYFYLMDVFTLLLAFYIPRIWFPALGAQIVSSLTYYVFLVISAQKSPSNFGALFLILAALTNIFLFGYLVWKQYQYICVQGKTRLSEKVQETHAETELHA